LRIRSAIAKVVQSCLDDERTLVLESKVVDATRRRVLIRLADERRRFAEELERFNGQGSRESWGSLRRELDSDVRECIAGRSTSEAVAACRRSQERTEARYDKVLALELPSEVKAALVTQHERVHAARDELAKMDG
jgi:hypothetical protein